MCKAILHEEKKGKMHYQIAVIINFLGHCISMVALLIAFFLFLCLRSIRCLRNIIHWNLITAFILRNATWFIVQLTMSPEVHESNVIWCRLVTASFNYFHSTNFFWMFGEGCYLHTAIVLTYSTDKLRKWMFICIGWCIPFPIIVAWAIGKLYYDNEKCWFGKRAGVYTDYIYQGPMILVLVVRVFFFFFLCPSVAAFSTVLHNFLIQLVFIMALKCLAGVKCWKPQHILHVSDDKCDVLTVEIPSITFKSLQLGKLRKNMGIILGSVLKSRNEIQGYVQACLYLLGIISNTGLFPYPQGKFDALISLFHQAYQSLCCHKLSHRHPAAKL
uniref:Corticotropin-releasing factor receptor 1 n=1 Tax=Dicentrarchus labrax TaxID=13489 RepID=E6ZI50_DICLA|nr:Corticotropin-releasing factor receptor 1 [Dicentrarchus labrax]